MSTISEPPMAHSQDDSEKNEFISAPKIMPPSQPPSMAPMTPRMRVAKIPPPCLPGRIALAMAPAMSPRMRYAMKPMLLTSLLRQLTGRVARCCCHCTTETRANCQVSLILYDIYTDVRQPESSRTSSEDLAKESDVTETGLNGRGPTAQ